jgi:hypothetical protein
MRIISYYLAQLRCSMRMRMRGACAWARCASRRAGVLCWGGLPAAAPARSAVCVCGPIQRRAVLTHLYLEPRVWMCGWPVEQRAAPLNVGGTRHARPTSEADSQKQNSLGRGKIHMYYTCILLLIRIIHNTGHSPAYCRTLPPRQVSPRIKRGGGRIRGTKRGAVRIRRCHAGACEIHHSNSGSRRIRNAKLGSRRIRRLRMGKSVAVNTGIQGSTPEKRHRAGSPTRAGAPGARPSLQPCLAALSLPKTIICEPVSMTAPDDWPRRRSRPHPFSDRRPLLRNARSPCQPPLPPPCPRAEPPKPAFASLEAGAAAALHSGRAVVHGSRSPPNRALPALYSARQDLPPSRQSPPELCPSARSLLQVQLVSPPQPTSELAPAPPETSARRQRHHMTAPPPQPSSAFPFTGTTLAGPASSPARRHQEQLLSSSRRNNNSLPFHYTPPARIAGGTPLTPRPTARTPHPPQTPPPRW